MAKADNKTQPTDVDPETFLATVEPERRRADGLALLVLFDRVTGLKAQMWGPTIIGYGRYHYKYESGREGSHLITGFSPRWNPSVAIQPGRSCRRRTGQSRQPLRLRRLKRGGC